MQALRNRNVVVAGHRTSIKLEPEFWRVLGDAAYNRNVNVFRLVEEAAKVDRGLPGTLTSAVRVYALRLAAEGVR
jgi:predicted DNA-binding ribbon-helix-helix protein